MRSTLWSLAASAGTLFLLSAIVGCGSARTSAGAGTTPAAPGAAANPPAASASAPSAGPVPTGFAAASVTFVSADETFVLGTAPCPGSPCTLIADSLDRGQTWQRLPAPAVALSQPGGTGAWGVRFASAEHGFVFGHGLWETTDGGGHWSRAAAPGGSIFSLAIVHGQVLALTASCSESEGCTGPGTLQRRPLAGGSWQLVGHATVTSLWPDPTDDIATQAGIAAVLDGNSVVVTTNGGLSTARHGTPCTMPGVAEPTSVAVIAPTGLALLCNGQGAMGHTDKTVYVSSDLGATWVKAGTPFSSGDGGIVAAAGPAQIVVATASAASWLYYSGDRAAHWQGAVTRDDGGQGWADLGFTTAVDGVVIEGTALTSGRAGKLLFTGNGGQTWQPVTF
jgi:hypothetical protein